MNQQTRSNHWRTFAILALIITAGIITGAVIMQLNSSRTPAYLSAYGGDFTLQSVHGPVSLSDFEGKVVAVYFGYTSCPDICPTSLAQLAAAMKKLEQDEAEKIQVLFVSFDPERDSLQHLDTYARNFHPNIIGITGSREQIDRVTKQYGAIYEKVELPNSAMKYAYDHSSISAVIDVKGNLRSLIRHQDTIEDMVAKLREAMHG